MTFDKFTIKAQEVVQEAVNITQRQGQQSIEPIHLLKGVMVKAKDVAFRADVLVEGGVAGVGDACDVAGVDHHLIFVSARREIVLDGFVSCKTSIHGNARRETEASLRSHVDVTGNILCHTCSRI